MGRRTTGGDHGSQQGRATPRSARLAPAPDGSERRQAFVLRLSDAIRPLRDPVRVQAEAMRVLGEHLGASRVHYAEVDDDENTIHIRASYHASGVASIVGVHSLDTYGFPVRQGMFARRTLVVADVSRVDGLTTEQRAAYRAVGTAALVGVPLVKAGRLLAIFVVHQEVPRAWTPEEVELIEETAERTWAVVERAQAELALRESEAKYRSLFTSIDEGFCIIEVLFDGERAIDYRFREVNPAFERHTGLTHAVGRRIRELVPDHDEHWFEIYGRVARTGESFRFQRPAMALGRFYDVYAFRVGSPEQRWVATLFNDITERKRAEEQLRESDRRKDEYLAMLGHELRNPLGAIRSAAEVLRRTETGDPALRRVYDLLDRQSSHMSRIIDGLLDVSRIAQGKIHLEAETIAVREVVARVLDDWAATIASSGLRLQTAVAAEPLWIMGDGARLVQVLDNLLGNALKFTPPPGVVRVAVEREGGCAVIRVGDTGVGIRPERIASIFEPFEQEAQDEARSTGGLGLGLALAKGIVELHHGTIEAHSAGPGTGAELVVRLPLAAAPVEEQAPRGEARAVSRRVLVVEDNDDAAEMLGELLGMLGHDVTLVPGGHEAMEALRQRRFDVVLCDLGIPGMSGHEVARAVRADAALRDMLLVAVTGYGQPDDRRRTVEAGFDEHLTKPVELDALDAAFGRHAAAGPRA
jgi:PAS domain S-box-containing protein